MMHPFSRTKPLPRARNHRRRLMCERLDSRRVLASWISEVHVDPLFGNRDTDQYVELRGTPNSTLPAGSYFVVVEGWGAVPGGPGYIHSVINLSGLTFGSNGFLVFAQSNNPYQLDPTATSIISTGPGFSGLPDNRWSDASTLSDRFAFIFNSATFLLIQSNQSPVPASDADVNDDGVLDTPWTVIDSVGLLNTTASPSRSYGKITFSNDPSYPAPTGTVVVDTDIAGYVARRGASVGWDASDWIAGRTIDDSANPGISYRFTFGTFGDPRPLEYSGRQINHVGTFNFDGGVVGTVAHDSNWDGTYGVGDTPIANASFFADRNRDGMRNNQSVSVIAGGYADGSEHTNRFANATLTVADANNKNIGFVVRTRSTFDNAFNTIQVLSSEGIPWFTSTSKLKAIFYREANSVAIDSYAASNQIHSYGRLEAYNRDGQLLDVYQTGPLLGLQRETMRITRATADIKYIVAYTNETVQGSSPFGALDKLIYTYPEIDGVSDADGRFAIEDLTPGTYDIRVLSAPSGQLLVSNTPSTYSLTVTRTEHVDNANYLFRNNLAPQVSTTHVSIPENPTIGATVGQIVAMDPDENQSVSFELIGNAGPFGVDSTTGAIKVISKAAWDFETMNPLVVQVRVRDNFAQPASTIANITLTPVDINEPPVIAENRFSISEKAPPGTQIGIVAATDADAGNNGSIRFFLDSSVPANHYALDSVTGKLTLMAGAVLDYALLPTLSIPVVVRDQATPSLASNGVVLVDLVDVNDPPRGFEFTNVLSVPESTTPLNSIQVATVRIIDDSMGANLVSLSGPNAALFSLNGGKLFFKAVSPLDFETRPSISVTLNVDDPLLGDTPDASVNFVLHITDVNEPPTGIRLTDLDTIPESANTSAGVRVATIQAIDDALGINAFRVDGPDASKFEIVGQQLRIKPGINLDFETQSEFKLNLTVDDPTVGSIPDASASFTIVLTDVNEPPSSLSLEVLTNFADESSIPTSGLAVANLRVQDDSLGTNSFVLSGLDSSSFEVVSNQLRIKPGVVFDFETKPNLDVTIQVVDDALPTNNPPQLNYRLTVRDLPEVISITDTLGNPLTASIQQVRLTWDSHVNVASGAIRTIKSDVGQILVPTTFSTSVIQGRTVADLSFSGPHVNAGTLREGLYTIFVDGFRVEAVGTFLNGANFRSNGIRALDPTLPSKLTLTGPAVVLSQQSFVVNAQLSEFNFPANENIDYRIDTNGDNIVDVSLTGLPTQNLSFQFATPGSRTLIVTAEKNGSKLAQSSMVVDVSPATIPNEDWLSGLDTDRDGTISPLDVLSVINRINSRTGNEPIPYSLNLDADRDGTISPLDALSLINYLNSDPASRTIAFSQLSMSQSGTVPGVTNEHTISGRIQGSSRNLFVSLNGSEKKDVSSLVQSDGSFTILDEAIAQLFGIIPDGSHTLSLFTRTDGRFSTASDRRFLRLSNSLADFQITSALDVDSIARLRWTNASFGARYRVYTARNGGPAEVTGTFASTEARIPLTAGQYQIMVEAFDAAGNTKRSASISLVIA